MSSLLVANVAKRMNARGLASVDAQYFMLAATKQSEPSKGEGCRGTMYMCNRCAGRTILFIPMRVTYSLNRGKVLNLSLVSGQD